MSHFKLARARAPKILLVLLCLVTLFQTAAASTDNCSSVPNRCDGTVHACWPRARSAPASQISQQMLPMTGDVREDFIAQELGAGHFPASFKKYKVISFNLDNGEVLDLSVSPDYLSLGTDQDYFRIPMRNITAQKIADEWGMMLPTSKMVDAIFFSADARIPADPLGASPEMTTTKVFLDSEEAITGRIEQVTGRSSKASYGDFIAGHKKDIVLNPKPGFVSIYGWYGDKDRGEGRMPYIQPEGGPHGRHYVDYSHGVRFISQWVSVRNNRSCRIMNLRDALKDPYYCAALSYKCPMTDLELSADTE